MVALEARAKSSQFLEPFYFLCRGERPKPESAVLRSRHSMFALEASTKSSECRTYGGNLDAQFILELAAGGAAKLGAVVGSKIDF